jgi:hypothetical protein
MTVGRCPTRTAATAPMRARRAALALVSAAALAGAAGAQAPSAIADASTADLRRRVERIDAAADRAGAARADGRLDADSYAAFLRWLRAGERAIHAEAATRAFRDITESNYWHRARLKFPSVTAQALDQIGIDDRDLPPVPLGRFDTTLERQGVVFHVICPNDRPMPVVTITAAGRGSPGRPYTRQVSGVVLGAETADLDGDGLPEVYVYAQASGDREEASLVAVAAREGDALVEIALAPLADGAGLDRGFRGHDGLRVAGDRLNRWWPLYKAGNRDDAPAGGWRQVRYLLEARGPVWRLRPDRVTDF